MIAAKPFGCERPLAVALNFFWLDRPQRIQTLFPFEAGRRRKAEPFRSAMSMLIFRINRAGRHLDTSQRRACGCEPKR